MQADSRLLPAVAIALATLLHATLPLPASEHWSYQALTVTSDLPAGSHPIDAFVMRQLADRKLSPRAPASPRTLIRRLTFDLIGLPPSRQEIAAFERASEEDSEAAWRALIDRLLASPHYGERWGRHWLDLVRYADTAGDAADFPVPEAYQYRNYVIASFNKDKPYDQFIREQLAGDLLPSTDDEQRWEQIIATGYVAISRRIGVHPDKLRHITIEDTLDNVGKTFLGLTLGCARCHDHKFDEISMQDYYALYGFFDSSVYPHAGAEHKPWRENFVYRIGKQKSDAQLRDLRHTLADWNKKERASFEIYRRFQREKVDDPSVTRASTWKEVLQVRAKRARFAASFPDLEIAYALADGKGHDVHLQKAGEPKDPGELVPRRFLQVLGGQKLPAGEKGSGRLHLAHWIADPKNPLTARVMVNRIWLHHFGEGLVSSASDFGVRGSVPSHPALLDHLAASFIESGWSVKAMHRQILTSQAYRRSSSDFVPNSEIDPENRSLWRFNRRRLDAEQLRDSILHFSAALDLAPGERHPFPHRLTYFYRQHDPFQEFYESNKRSIYLMQQRIQKSPWLDLFDGPDGNTPVEERNESTTPLQALYFMNSEFAHEQADRIATRLLAEHQSFATRLSWAYHAIFNRPPSAEDSARSRAHLASVRNSLSQSDQRAWSGLIRGMISSNEFMFVD